MLLVLLVVLGGLLAQPAVAAPLLTAMELMTRIDAAQKDLHSLRADFVQHSRVKLFRQQISSTGRFLYAKGTPARLRWSTLRPIPRRCCWWATRRDSRSAPGRRS
jgi:outer membrane lipoprotein-sorting protein